MQRSLVSLRRAAGAIALLAGAAAPAAAQVTTETSGGHSMLAGKSLDITPYAGYMMFGNFIDGPLGTSLSSSAAALYGAQLGMTLMPGVKLIGNVAHASGDLRVGIPFIGGVSAGTTSALVADGGVELSIPTPNGAASYTPFIQAGVGAMRWGINLGSTGVNTTSTNLSGNLGGGLDLNFGPSLALRLMAKDYIGKFDFKQATSFGISGKTSQNWALTAGLRLAF